MLDAFPVQVHPLDGVAGKNAQIVQLDAHHITQEWMLIAGILDRLFLVTFFTISLTSTLVLWFNHPNNQ